MAGNDSQSGTDNRLEIGAAVQRARDAGMTWKDIERRWGRDRSTLWRWAVVAAECNKIGTCCNIFGVDPATSSSEPWGMDDLACSTCPHWRRLKSPGSENLGRCMLRDGGSREDSEYCGDHPVLVARRNADLAVAVGSAVAGVLVEMINKSRNSGESNSPMIDGKGRGKR